MRVLVTGGKGQLGREIVSLLAEQKVEVIGFGREELDITDYTQVKKKLYEVMPDVIIHAAAFTDVDLAEDEPDNAFLVNGIGTENIAIAASKIKAKLVYISTDYVFSGSQNEPLEEGEPPCPLGVYGQTKLKGENFVKKHLTNYFIIRTSWVYGEHGNNFVKTMLKLSEEKRQLTVVNDQIGCPTYTFDLAQLIAMLIDSEKYGIYHISNTGSCSWYEFAQAIFEIIDREVNIVPCKSSEFPRKAPRPKYSVLKGASLKENHFPEMRHWREALTDFLEHYLVKNEQVQQLSALKERYRGW